MSYIGQIVYNVEDFSGSGGLISSHKENPLIARINSNDNEYENNKIKIYFPNNVFQQIGIDKILKIGIQAPPGTQFYLGNSNFEDSMSLMIGRTGIYELDLSESNNSNNISYLSFKQPINYIVNEAKSNNFITEGVNGMNQAKKIFEEKISQLQSLYETPTGSQSNKTYWEDYDNIYLDYKKEYENFRSIYLQGMDGCYEQTGESELNNIIIDFYYDKQTSSN